MGLLLPDITPNRDGDPVVVWQENPGTNRICALRCDGSSWVEMGAGSARGGGISDRPTYCYNPSIAVDPSGSPLIAWESSDTHDTEIYVRRWNIVPGTWEELDGSGNPVVAWKEERLG